MYEVDLFSTLLVLLVKREDKSIDGNSRPPRLHSTSKTFLEGQTTYPRGNFSGKPGPQ